MELNFTEEIFGNGSLVGAEGYPKPPINVPGLIGVIVFYGLILFIGIFASWKNKSLKASDSEDVMVAGRSIGTILGIFTLTATWVGGGFINGAAEIIYTDGAGLAWCQGPVGYACSLIIGGLLFARKMCSAGYITMLDPFEIKYGQVMTAFLYIPCLLGDIFWSAAILSALGASLHVILGISHLWSVILSTGIAVIYTMIGGLYSVSFTDVIQLICIFIGLWLATGYSLASDVVTNIGETARDPVNSWIGSIKADRTLGNYIDSYLLIIFGGIPWQVYFQRILSLKKPSHAHILSFSAAIGVLIMGIPPVLLGAIAKSTDWNATEYRHYGPIPPTDSKTILPLVMQYVCPQWVSVIGLGAISAAVMSSADSSMLSASTMFARNVYTPIRNALSKNSQASEREIIWTMRISVFFVGLFSMGLAIVVDSIYGLWLLCADLVYVVLFPQLLLVIYLPFANTYGSIGGYVTGALVRCTSGEPMLYLPTLIKYPYYDEETDIQNFPIRTFSMLLNLLVIITVSYITDWMFKSGRVSLKYDVLGCFKEKEKEELSDGVEIVEKNTLELKNGHVKKTKKYAVEIVEKNTLEPKNVYVEKTKKYANVNV